MFSDAELHLCYRFGNAQVNEYPFPHFYVEEAFPAAFYAELQRMLPDPEAMKPIAEVRPVRGYKERFVLPLADDALLQALPDDRREFWTGVRSMLVGGRFANLALRKFSALLDERFQRDPAIGFYDEAMLVQDTTHYSLGPHSDAPRKVITMLFYLPRDMSQRHLGTSIYLPREPDFRDPGGPHYEHRHFERLWTMPFVPNALFVFFKTDNSFHGVEPVKDPDTRRWLLLYDIHFRRDDQET